MSVLLRALISMTWNVQQPTEAPSVNTCAHSAVDTVLRTDEGRQRRATPSLPRAAVIRQTPPLHRRQAADHPHP